MNMKLCIQSYFPVKMTESKITNYKLAQSKWLPMCSREKSCPFCAPLVVSNLQLKTKGSLFEYDCYLYAEVSFLQ